MTHFRRIPLLALLLALTTLVGLALAQDDAPTMPGEGVTVQPAVANWQSALPVEAIVGNVLAELGYDVQGPRTLSNPIFYQAVAQGDVDYWANSWLPQQQNLLTDRVLEGAEVVGTIVPTGAIQGYLVDKASAEAYDITSLADFQRPEVVEAFDTDGDGVIQMLACTEGWACTSIVDHHLETYELQDVIEPITSAYTPGFADVLARYRNGEPVLYYTWTPNFTVSELVPGEDVVWINVPEIAPTETQEGMVESMTATGVEGAVTDPIRLGFTANDIRVTANRAFLEANPVARELFEQIRIPLADVADMTVRVAEGENSSEALNAMADEWIAANRDAVDGWLEAARAAASSGSSE